MSRADRCLRLAQELVTIDSQNPGSGEGACAAFVGRWLHRFGFEVSEHLAATGRPNLVARRRGRGERRPLAFVGHLDTVPVGEGWTVPPLGGAVINGALYGRGAADMKGGLAAAMVAAADLAALDGPVAADLWVVCTCDEEGPAMLGANGVVQHRLLPGDALMLIPEPTAGRWRCAHVGGLWLEVVTRGRMAHAGKAWLGADAIHAMAEVVHAMKESIANLRLVDPVLGHPQVTIGRIEGGIKTNVVPPLCRAEVDCRVVPPFNCQAVLQLLVDAAEKACRQVPGTAVSVDVLGVRREPFATRPSSPLANALEAAYVDVVGRPLESGGNDRT